MTTKEWSQLSTALFEPPLSKGMKSIPAARVPWKIYPTAIVHRKTCLQQRYIGEHTLQQWYIREYTGQYVGEYTLQGYIGQHTLQEGYAGKYSPQQGHTGQYTRQGHTEEYTLGYSRYSQQGCRTGNKSSKYVRTCTPQLCVLKQQPSHVHLRCTNHVISGTSSRQSQNIQRWHAFLVAFSILCLFFLFIYIYFFTSTGNVNENWRSPFYCPLIPEYPQLTQSNPLPILSAHLYSQTSILISPRFYKTKMILLIHTYTQFILTYKNIQHF